MSKARSRSRVRWGQWPQSSVAELLQLRQVEPARERRRQRLPAEEPLQVVAVGAVRPPSAELELAHPDHDAHEEQPQRRDGDPARRSDARERRVERRERRQQQRAPQPGLQQQQVPGIADHRHDRRQRDEQEPAAGERGGRVDEAVERERRANHAGVAGAHERAVGAAKPAEVERRDHEAAPPARVDLARRAREHRRRRVQARGGPRSRRPAGAATRR